MFGVRRSQLKASVFVEQPLGLFTVQSIAKNSRLSLSSDLVVRMNDADMDLTSLIGVLDPLELERRLDACLSQYSELDQNNVSSDLIARRDIAPDEELFRKYGWGVWLREMAEMDGLLNERNFAGLASCFLGCVLLTLGSKVLRTMLSDTLMWQIWLGLIGSCRKCHNGWIR
jgi:hypothetical protein